MKKNSLQDMDENTGKKKNSQAGRKTYFRIKSAGNARPEKMQ